MTKKKKQVGVKTKIDDDRSCIVIAIIYLSLGQHFLCYSHSIRTRGKPRNHIKCILNLQKSENQQEHHSRTLGYPWRIQCELIRAILHRGFVIFNRCSKRRIHGISFQFAVPWRKTRGIYLLASSRSSSSLGSSMTGLGGLSLVWAAVKLEVAP